MLIVDDDQRTSVPGVYAVGDVVAGLTQIGVAMGQAAIAASTINRNGDSGPASSRRKRLIKTDDAGGNRAS
jgi:thioredoxin reductase (NADPH)